MSVQVAKKTVVGVAVTAALLVGTALLANYASSSSRETVAIETAEPGGACCGAAVVTSEGASGCMGTAGCGQPSQGCTDMAGGCCGGGCSGRVLRQRYTGSPDRLQMRRRGRRLRQEPAQPMRAKVGRIGTARLLLWSQISSRQKCKNKVSERRREQLGVQKNAGIEVKNLRLGRSSV